MSYILDALKRADAERERGHVPGLHTHNAPTGAARPTRMRWPAKSWVFWVAGGFMLVALAAWWLRPAPVTPAVPPQGAGSVATPELSVPAQPQAKAEVAPASQPVGAETTPPPPASNTPAQAVLPLLAPASSTPPQAQRSSTSAQKPLPAVEATTPAAAPPPAPVRSFAELSPEARAALPAVSVNGSTYSQNPAHRMLIANGKVVQEGQEIAPGLVLETIGPSSAVLSHRGQRYSIGY